MIFCYVRADPRSLDSCGGTCGEAPEHDADHGEPDEGGGGCRVAFEIEGQATVSTDPGKCSFNNPPLWEHLKSSSIRTLDDLQTPRTGAPHRHCHFAPGVSAISKNAFNEGKETTRSA